MRACDHIAFQVSDMDFAIQFYVDQLGFVLSSKAENPHEQEAYAFLSLEDLRLELIQNLKETAYEKPQIKFPYCPSPGARDG